MSRSITERGPRILSRWGQFLVESPCWPLWYPYLRLVSRPGEPAFDGHLLIFEPS